MMNSKFMDWILHGVARIFREGMRGGVTRVGDTRSGPPPPPSDATGDTRSNAGTRIH